MCIRDRSYPLCNALVGIPEAGYASVLIATDPSGGHLIVSFHDDSWLGMHFALLDMSGRIVIDEPITSPTESISLHRIALGNYLVRLINGDKSLAQRIVVNY